MVEHPFCSYDLDCYHSRVLDKELVRKLEDHLELCSDCVAYLDNLSKLKKEQLLQKPTALFVEEVFDKAQSSPTKAQSSPTESWLASLFSNLYLSRGVVALTFCLLVGAFGLYSWRTRTSSDTLRWMGTTGVIKAYLKRGNNVRLLTKLSRVQKDDALRFQAHFSTKIHLVIFFMDERGKISWYVPERSEHAPLHIQAKEYASPGSVVFDDSTMTERVFVYWQQKAFVPNDLIKRIKFAWLHRKQSSLFQEKLWLPKIPNLWSIPFVKK